ncbi:ATP-dependent DNA helicase RecQ [Bacteroides zoogleoformans]|uniref:ATP-dependent DNA helicase RecQ n=1 Tax=Bacteroides zoogleoformans TaxID=28119 RepID=A0ABM6TA80_9BACE|nr:ATP-dependent DNA helicase RecQ [Bacteroides zoogleoformans]AVM53738.1 RecQ family ATP-dependent DNA helicase [Bacteroides zoogleoformans]TWJ18150.1 ATP-dependent DNA helicase RecQ [Bacteroides zoogleoformans]
MNKSNFSSHPLWEKEQKEVSPCHSPYSVERQRGEAAEPELLLHQYWGYTSFRGIQKDIISSILTGKDTLGLMPTGGGKSITFQVPALAQEGLCLVITPLIALMKDQVQNLKKRGIKALAIYSGMSRQEIIATLENCIFGNFKFLYISPERLDTEIFRTKVQKMKICMITVDESHCISQWGYDFRPAYLKIAEIRQLLPGIPVLALTATATPEVVKDIQKRLNFRKENVFRMSFERKNLAYIVRKTENKTGELLHILRRTSGSAIIYVRNRRRTKEITELLHNENITADFYHAGLDDATKDIRQQRWQTGESRVMVATNAFGMGIDKPDVRIVLHMDLPDSIEAYFQEAGRAGRDGEKAYAVILYAKSDSSTLHKRIPDTFPEKEYIKDVYEHLQYYYQMAMGDGQGCVREFNIEDFCRKFKYFPVPVDSALKLLTLAGYLEYTDEQDNASRLLFTIRRDELYKLKEMDDDTDKLIQTILRSYTGVFTDYAFINEDSLATRSGLARQQVYELLIRLAKLHIISYIPQKKTPYIIYARKRVEKHHLQIPPSVYEERKERYEKRIAAMLDYIGNDTACRSRLLLRYFGEKNEHDCGQCDTCISLKRKATKDIPTKSLVENILQALSEQAMTPATLFGQLSADKEQLCNALHELLDEGQIIVVNGMLEVKK